MRATATTSRDANRASVLEPALVPLQSPQSQHHRQAQQQRLSQISSVSDGMEAGPSQQVGFRRGLELRASATKTSPLCQKPNLPRSLNTNAIERSPRSLSYRRRSPVPQLPHINTAVVHASELERLPTEPMPSSPPPPPSPAQPTPKKLLERYGIKVRDFAYESTLPPVRTVPRAPPPRDLARRREYGNWFGGPPPEPMTDEMRKKRQDLMMPRIRYTKERDLQAAKELERYPTEPILDNSQESSIPRFTMQNMLMGNARGLLPRLKTAILSDAGGPCKPAHEQTSQSPHSFEPQSQQSQYQSSSQPPLAGYSQADSDMDGLETPLITPDASQILLGMDGVTDSSALPESQVAQILSNLQVPTTEDVSFSQMGIESQTTDSQMESQNNSYAMEGITNDGPATVEFTGTLESTSAAPAVPLAPSSSPTHQTLTPLSVSIRRAPSATTSRRSVSSPVASPLISRHPSVFGTGLSSRKRSYSQTSLSSLSSLSRSGIHSHEDLQVSPGSPFANVRRNGPSRENEPLPCLGLAYAAPTSDGVDGIVNAGGRYNLRKIRKTATTDATVRSLPSPARLSPQKSFDVGKKVVSRSSAHAAKKGGLTASPSPRARSRSRARAPKKGKGAETAPASPIKNSVRRPARERT